MEIQTELTQWCATMNYALSSWKFSHSVAQAMDLSKTVYMKKNMRSHVEYIWKYLIKVTQANDSLKRMHQFYICPVGTHTQYTMHSNHNAFYDSKKSKLDHNIRQTIDSINVITHAWQKSEFKHYIYARLPIIHTQTGLTSQIYNLLP